jgi:hypothetical protein
MSTEANFRRKFSEKSDVWAFGVLLWELWSQGEVPLAAIASDEKVANRVESGERLAQAESCSACSQASYDPMQRCWAIGAAERQSFVELHDGLLALHVSVTIGPEPTCVICLERPPTMPRWRPSPVASVVSALRTRLASFVGGSCPICRKRVVSVLTILGS